MSRSKEPADRNDDLGATYQKVMSTAVGSESERLELANRLYDLALRSPDAQLTVVEHTGDDHSKAVEQHYKLTDPRAALLMMLRFCNIWLPIPALVCIKAGCAIFKAPVPPFRLGCFLIGCAVNVCPGPGGARFACIYLCI